MAGHPWRDPGLFATFDGGPDVPENSRCSVPGDSCSPPGGRITAGMCNKHYKRARRHDGDPLGGAPSPGVARAFLDMAVAYSGDDCLLWPFSLTPGGYGVLNYQGRRAVAHRLVYCLVTGMPYDSPLSVAHAPVICHTRNCVTPNHLQAATREENMAHKLLDGTATRGTRHWQAKLTEDAVRSIRRRDGENPYDLALEFGVSKATIHGVWRRQVWAWLPDDPTDDEAAA